MPSPPPPSLSPLDDRYREAVRPLALIFGERNLTLHRIRVELRWLLQLAGTGAEPLQIPAAGRAQLEQFASEIEDCIADSENNLQKIDEIYSEVKAHEARTRHDVKAVEYWLREQFERRGIEVPVSRIHFGCTSEDINSLSWGCMLRDGLDRVLLPGLHRLIELLGAEALEQAATPMLSRTHGQSASPTTWGKEIAIYCSRLQEQLNTLSQLKPRARFGGATGNYSAHNAALPGLDWPAICRALVEDLGLEYSPCTTQVEGGDRLAEICHCLMRVGRVLTDLARDFWGYVSLGYLRQQRRQGEVGSSTMPHKVNPIDFENAEGNLAMAHSMLERLAADLPVSRWQRDLSGSTLQRNLGAALGHCHLGWQSIERGLARVQVDAEAMDLDLQQHWEVLAEAVQTALRLSGDPAAYERLHGAGEALDRDKLQQIIQEADLDEGTRQRLLQLTPQQYTGLAAQLARRHGSPQS